MYNIIIVIVLSLSITTSCFVLRSPFEKDSDDNNTVRQVYNSIESRVSRPHYVNYIPHHPTTNRHPYLMRPGYFYPHNYRDRFGQNQHFMDVIESIAARDELNCIPKFLCQMTSTGRRNDYNNNDKRPNNFVSLDSLATLLAGIDDSVASSLVKFGKALILGYTAKQSAQCQYAYPQCPNDPEQLVNYLNIQNSDLLRLFSTPSKLPHRLARPWKTKQEDNNPFNIYGFNPSGDKKQYAWQFPYENDVRIDYDKGKSLKFPNEQKDDTYEIRNVKFLFPENNL